MFYRKLNINGTEYPLAVTLVGSGEPQPDLEAEIGMFYMDETNTSVYKCIHVNSEGFTEWEKFGEKTVVDWRYDETSVNAQSGQAVAQAIFPLSVAIGNFETALDATIALCDAYIRGGVE